MKENVKELSRGTIESITKKPKYWAVKIDGKTYNTKEETFARELEKNIGNVIIEALYDESSFKTDSGDTITMKWISGCKEIVPANKVVEEKVSNYKAPIRVSVNQALLGMCSKIVIENVGIPNKENQNEIADAIKKMYRYLSKITNELEEELVSEKL